MAQYRSFSLYFCSFFIFLFCNVPSFFEMLLGYLIFGSSIDSPVNFLKNDDIGSMFIFLPASAQLRTFLELFMVLCCSSCIKPSPFLVT